MTAFWSVAWKKHHHSWRHHHPRLSQRQAAGRRSHLHRQRPHQRRRQDLPAGRKEGDRILFGKYSGTEIKIDGEDFIIMKEEEVLGILTGAATPAKKELAGCK